MRIFGLRTADIPLASGINHAVFRPRSSAGSFAIGARSPSARVLYGMPVSRLAACQLSPASSAIVLGRQMLRGAAAKAHPMRVAQAREVDDGGGQAACGCA
jgi:hypothetical protein